MRQKTRKTAADNREDLRGPVSLEPPLVTGGARGRGRLQLAPGTHCLQQE